MKILNKWNCSEFELVLFENERGVYQIDINNTKDRETNYCYEFKDKKEALGFFESMWKHIFIV
jgi:hypothetical protein